MELILISLSLSPLSPHSRTQAGPKSPWHHSKALTSVSPGHSNLVRTALSRSDIDLDQVQISQQDLRILEILTIRCSKLPAGASCPWSSNDIIVAGITPSTRENRNSTN